MKQLHTLFFLIMLLLMGTSGFAQSKENATDIIKKLEKNRVFDGLYAEGTITVKDKYGTRVTSFVSKSKGSEYSLIEYTSSAEKGQKDLRVGDKIYLYYPDAEQVITLNKSMFQQSMLDSDISYEDVSGDKSILDSFQAALEGEEERDGIATYKIYLSAKNDRKETYPYQRIWVSKKNYSVVYAENYTRKKKLRKTLTVLKTVQLSNGAYFSSEILIKDVLKQGEGTTVTFENITLQSLSDKEFSIEALKF